MHMLEKTRKVVTMGFVLVEGHSEEFGYIKVFAVGNASVYENKMQQNNQRCQNKRKRASANTYRQLVYTQIYASTKRAKNRRRNLATS